MKPHKYAEIIKAWADGVEVEVRFRDAIRGWLDWAPVAQDGRFITDPWWEYRIKPGSEPKVKFETNIRWDKGWQHVDTNHNKEPNLRLLFSVDTGDLVSAEVI